MFFYRFSIPIIARLANPIPMESDIIVKLMSNRATPEGSNVLLFLVCLALVVMLFIYEDGTVERVVEMEE